MLTKFVVERFRLIFESKKGTSFEVDDEVDEEDEEETVDEIELLVVHRFMWLVTFS